MGFLLPTAEDFRILLDVVIDPMVEVDILLIVPALMGVYYRAVYTVVLSIIFVNGYMGVKRL